MRWTQHKFRSVITERDGLKFRSKKEAAYYDMLKAMKLAGKVLFWIRQPKFDLPGNVTYAADFLVFYADGNAEFVDVKGMKTKEYIRNKKMVESLYPVSIIEA